MCTNIIFKGNTQEENETVDDLPVNDLESIVPIMSMGGGGGTKQQYNIMVSQFQFLQLQIQF